MSYEATYEPLLSAIRDGDISTVDRYLTSAQYSVNSDIPYRSEDGKHYILSPLYWAVKYGHRDMCRYLLRKGADPWAHMVYEYYPLHEACNRGCAGILQEFISAGIGLDRTNSDQDTPLHIACMRGHIECVKLLLSAGADQKIRNIRGQTPLEAARFNGHADLCKLFEVFDKDPAVRRTRVTEPSCSKHPRQPQSCERRHSLTSGSQVQSRHRPLSMYDMFLPKTGMVSNRTMDDTSVPPKLLHPAGVNRALSFTEMDRHDYIMNPMAFKTSPLIQHRRSPARRKLSAITHESQLILPTQPLVPDTKRTQTIHDFGSSLDHCLSSQPMATTPDDLELDHAHRSPRSTAVQSQSKVKSLCQHTWEEAQTSCPAHPCPALQSTRKRLICSLYSKMGMDEEACQSLQSSSEEFCSNILRNTRNPWLLQSELHRDYELVDWQPILVGQGLPARNSAHMVFRVRLHDSRVRERAGSLALIKVTVSVFNLESKEEAEQYHSGNHGSPMLCDGKLLERIPSHPQIAGLVFYCTADSKPFEKFTRLFCPEDGHMSLKMAPQASLVCVRDQPSTLSHYFRLLKLHHSHPPFGLDEKSILSLLAQLLLAMAHLDQHGAVVSCLQMEDVYRNDTGHLLLGNLNAALDLAELMTHDVRAHLAGLSEEILLLSPPELCHLADCPLSEVCSMSQQELQDLLHKCNSFGVGRLFLSMFISASAYEEKQLDQFEDCTFFSQSVNNLLRRLVSTLPRDRITAHEGAMWCLSLLYGPHISEVESSDDCSQWLFTETVQYYLRPALKGLPKDYSSDCQLLFQYLLMASAESVWNAVQLRTRDSAS